MKKKTKNLQKQKKLKKNNKKVDGFWAVDDLGEKKIMNNHLFLNKKKKKLKNFLRNQNMGMKLKMKKIII